MVELNSNKYGHLNKHQHGRFNEISMVSLLKPTLPTFWNQYDTFLNQPNRSIEMNLNQGHYIYHTWSIN